MSTQRVQTEATGAVIPEWSLADRLRKARQIAQMDQRNFAQALGVTASAYAQWEASNSRPRDVVTIAKQIQMLTRVPATWILNVDIAPEPAGPNGQPSDYKAAISRPVAVLADHRVRRVTSLAKVGA